MFSIGRIVWKGRLCAQNQSEYNRAMDHITAEFQQQPCSTETCELCDYRSMDDARIDSELTSKNKAFFYFIFIICLIYSCSEKSSIDYSTTIITNYN